ncbi:MAG: redoxin domain-containing protein [Acidobacteria bacterium]|nr:MAG: redoxin domain-containing protein [Acidobacteriota bacterium]
MSAIVGELALEFSLPDTDTHVRWLSEFHRLGPVVLLFMPSAYGWRPRWQLWSLLRHYDSFVEMATEVVVVTRDPLPELRIFQIRRGFPFVFLSDRDGAVARSYDVLPGRAGAFVITTTGVIRLHRVVEGMGLRSSGASLLRLLHRLDGRDRLPARAR